MTTEARERELAERLEVALDAAGLGTWRWDIASGRVEWDERLEALYGFEPGAFPGTFEAYHERIHPEDRERMLAVVARSREDRRPYRVEHRVVWPDGTLRWVQGSGQVIVDEDTGEVTGAIGCSMDVTALMEARLELATSVATAEAATERERAHRQRLEFLGRINDALAAAITRDDIMEQVTRAAVPRMGDWCLVYVANDTGGPPDRVAAHADPSREAMAHDLAKNLTGTPTPPRGCPPSSGRACPSSTPSSTPPSSTARRSRTWSGPWWRSCRSAA